MFSNQSVSRFRCKHQANHWCHGLYLPYQVLVLVLSILLSPTVLAEKEYYTWVDEFGRVHNTLIDPTSKKETKKSASKLARSEEHTSELQSRPHLVCRLLLEKKKKKYKKNVLYKII